MNKGADVNGMTWNEHTALTFAAEGCRVKAVQMLLERGAEVNKHGVNSPPLATAAQNGHVEVIKLLRQHNADVNAQDADGDSALHETVYSRSTECARVLVRGLSVDVVVDIRNKSGWTPLMATVQRELVEVVDILLGKGASVELKTEDGRTALHIAAEEGRADVIGLLLRRGANVDAANLSKWTPLMLAAYRGHKETVKLLVKEGASLTVKNKDGAKAAEIAKLNNRTDLLDLLQSGIDLER